jgi:D-3-phosphoglycerate dehydrogenase / 2-oxoglutarate reductase
VSRDKGKTFTVAIACNRRIRERSIGDAELDRLRTFAEVRIGEFDRPADYVNPPPPDADADEQLSGLVADADALVISAGSPRVTAATMDACPNLRFVGDLEGDRFASRIDVRAAWSYGVRVVDTTNGSSNSVAEWALALILIGLRNAGDQFRGVLGHKPWYHDVEWNDRQIKPRELTGRTIGFIGCGLIGRRLLELLRPFRTTVYAYDPYVPNELAEIYDITFASLENVLALSEVVVCLAPLTPATKEMLGEREFGLMKDQAIFVNVSRGAIVQTDALVRKVEGGALIASLDVHDPEPIPLDSPLIDLQNTFLTPHTAGTTVEARLSNFKLMVDELERFAAGHATRYDLLPRTITNRTGGSPEAPE